MRPEGGRNLSHSFPEICIKSELTASLSGEASSLWQKPRWDKSGGASIRDYPGLHLKTLSKLNKIEGKVAHLKINLRITTGRL